MCQLVRSSSGILRFESYTRISSSIMSKGEFEMIEHELIIHDTLNPL